MDRPSYDFDTPIEITFDDLSPADLEDFQEIAGVHLLAFAEEMQSGRIDAHAVMAKLKPFTAIFWVIWRKRHPALTHEDVRQLGFGEFVKGIKAINVKKTAPLKPLRPNKRSGNPNLVA